MYFFKFKIGNGIQLLYRPSDVQCDWPERVECKSRLVCDKWDENCNVQKDIIEDFPCENISLPNGEACPETGLQVRKSISNHKYQIYFIFS